MILNTNTYTSDIIVASIDMGNVPNVTYTIDNHVSPMNVMYQYPNVIYGHTHMEKQGEHPLMGSS